MDSYVLYNNYLNDYGIYKARQLDWFFIGIRLIGV